MTLIFFFFLQNYLFTEMSIRCVLMIRCHVAYLPECTSFAVILPLYLIHAVGSSFALRGYIFHVFHHVFV